MNEYEQEYIREEVSDLFSFSLSMFGLADIIDCSDKLTAEEKAWAKKNIDWCIVILNPAEVLKNEL